MLLLLYTLLLASTTTNTALAEMDITIATGTVGGSYYPLGTAIAKIWGENIDGIRAKAIKTAGTAQNIQLMKENKADVAFPSFLKIKSLRKGDRLNHSLTS